MFWGTTFSQVWHFSSVLAVVFDQMVWNIRKVYVVHDIQEHSSRGTLQRVPATLLHSLYFPTFYCTAGSTEKACTLITFGCSLLALALGNRSFSQPYCIRAVLRGLERSLPHWLSWYIISQALGGQSMFVLRFCSLPLSDSTVFKAEVAILPLNNRGEMLNNDMDFSAKTQMVPESTKGGLMPIVHQSIETT